MPKLVIKYPTREEEVQILRENISDTFPMPNKVLSPADILKARNLVKMVYMDEKIEQYILDIIFATRYPQEFKLEKLQQFISFGASPRGSIFSLLLLQRICF